MLDTLVDRHQKMKKFGDCFRKVGRDKTGRHVIRLAFDRTGGLTRAISTQSV